jgi:hypothetical protein
MGNQYYLVGFVNPTKPRTILIETILKGGVPVSTMYLLFIIIFMTVEEITNHNRVPIQ